MIDGVLEEIGLTGNEIKVYKTLLKIGIATTGPITREAKIHKSRVYEALERLIEKGLVSYKIESNIKYYSAQEPESILEFLDEKKNKVETIIPILKEIQKEDKNEDDATVFTGYNGVKSVLKSFLKDAEKGDEQLVFGARSGMDTDPDVWEFFFKYYGKRREEINLGLRIIYNEDLRGTSHVLNHQKMKLTKVRFSNQKTPAGINICKDKTAIFVWKENPVVFVIKSKETANSFREYFEVLWSVAKE